MSITTFINKLVADPELASVQPNDATFVYTHSIKRLDEFSESLNVNLTSDTDNLVNVLDAIPSPNHSIASTINYLIVVRKYLIEARRLNLPYPKDELENIIRGKISISNKIEVLCGDYCTNLYYNISSIRALSVGGGIVGGLTGTLIGFPIGFFLGCSYLVTRPIIMIVLGLMCILRGCNLLRR